MQRRSVGCSEESAQRRERAEVRARLEPGPEAEHSMIQIDKDVPRTMTEHIYFRTAGGHGQEALTRVLAAVPLADLIYRAAPAEGAQLPDVGLVEALLLVVEPTAFVPNLDMLRNPAEQRLLRHTGRMMVGAKTMSWRNWWRVQKNTFLGVRSSITVDASNAGGAVVTLRQEDRTVRMLGEDVAGASRQATLTTL